MTEIKATPKRPPFVPPSSPASLVAAGRLRAAGVIAGIKASGRPDVALLVGDAAHACAAVFTKNAFAAAPVVVCREHLARTGGRVAAIVVNSGNANACTGERGIAHARAMCERTAALVGCEPAEVLVASTGVIGVPLPIDRVLEGIERAHAELGRDDAAAARFLAAIQTTDAFEKAWGEARDGLVCAGVAKGAGMIEPDMATMLAFVATNAGLDAEALRGAVGRVARASFNAVHVDSHASTNDSAFFLATGAAPHADRAAAIESMERVAHRLAWLIARDGEGATKVTTIDVRGAGSDAAAEDIARRVARSALVRTALFGNDPNWGRFVSAVGNSPVAGDASRLVCKVQGVLVFAGGEPASFDRAALAQAMAADDVRLELDLGKGAGGARVLTSDLGYRYVEVNAEYTT